MPGVMGKRQAGKGSSDSAARLSPTRPATCCGVQPGGEGRTKVYSLRSVTALAQRLRLAQPAAAHAPTADQGLTRRRTLAADSRTRPKRASAQPIAGAE